MAIPGGNIPAFLNLQPVEILALTAYGEAGREPIEGIMAVINVIMNRTTVPGTYADSSILSMTGSVIHAVVLKPLQFSIYNSDDASYNTMINMASNFQSYLASNSALQTCYNLAQMAVANTLQDNTGGATNYLTKSLYQSGTVSWAKPNAVLGIIGNHVFLSLGPIGQRIQQAFEEVSQQVQNVFQGVDKKTIYILGAMAVAAALAISFSDRRR